MHFGSARQIRHRAVVSIAVIAAAIGVMAQVSAGAGGVSVTQTVTNQWTSGYQADLSVRNNTGSTIKAWRLEFDLPHQITSLWNATLVSQVNNHVVIDAPAWQPDLPTGTTATLGYVANLTGARQDPTNCKINGLACSFTGSGSTTTSAPSASSTSAPVTTTSTVKTPVGLAYATTDSWVGGYNAEVDITNGAAATVNGWTLTFKLPNSTMTQMWNGTYTRAADGTYTVRNASWNGTIAAGQSTSVGFGANGTSATPTNCTFNGTPCTFGVGGPTTTSTSTTTSTTVAPSTTTTAPNGGTVGGVPPFAVAPYVDATLWPTIDLPSLARADGVKTYTLGFIVNGQGSCRATWGTYYNLGDNWMADQISALRSMGGDVVVSFGGAANQELAQACTTVSALQAQYQAVIDAYGLKSIDFDVEGAATADAASIARRSQAIAQLQQQARAAGRNLQVSLTLPVLPTGLTSDGLNVVRSARDNGVDVAVVNVMAMDYGAPSDHMGADAVQAATSTHNQLATLYPAKTDAQLWAMVGVTPMIGQNDIAGEVFTTSDAQQLTTFAKTQHLGRLAFWSANRDVQCSQGVKTSVDNLCSGVLQSPNQFASTFGQFAG
ncbi:MAG: cellulose binding domain-containing protein [Acidimicrobiia bacterium]|nr:cellulose binding domain-containing protein [Acidimicrobiia bacterium]